MDFFFFNNTATTEIYTLSLHDALPICSVCASDSTSIFFKATFASNSLLLARATANASSETSQASTAASRSEEHTSELQSRQYLVCRLLLEKKKPPVLLSTRSLALLSIH